MKTKICFIFCAFLSLRMNALVAGVVSSEITGYTCSGANANIVGYKTFSSRKGMFAVGMSEVNGSAGLRLSCIKPQPEDDAVVLRFYDGLKWQEAAYRLCTDNAYHWLSKEESFLLDDEVVPVGATIVYELPDGVESLSVAGEVGRIEDAVNMTAMEMIPRREMEEEVRRVHEMVPKETVRTVVITNSVKEYVSNRIVVTNFVVVTNTVVPDRFIVRFSNGETKLAKWSWQFLKAIDPVSGVPLNLDCGKVSFEEAVEVPVEQRATPVQCRRFYDEHFSIFSQKKAESIGARFCQKGCDWLWGKSFDWIFAAVAGPLILLLWSRFRQWRRSRKACQQQSAAKLQVNRRSARKKKRRRH